MNSHILLEPDARYTRALVCGSPERAQLFAAQLDNHQLLKKNREYHSYLGQYKGHDILITSHGVGSAGAAICFQELINVGVQRMIRVGTAGGLYDELQVADVVLPLAAARKDGVSDAMVPKGLPAVPSWDLTNQLRQSLRDRGWQGREGTIVTVDLFYPGILDDELSTYQKAGAIAVEMECSTLFVICQLRQVQAAAVLVCDGNPLKWEEGLYDPRPEKLAASVDLCRLAALDALIS